MVFAARAIVSCNAGKDSAVMRKTKGGGEDDGKPPLRTYGANAGFRLLHVHNYRAQDGRGRE